MSPEDRVMHLFYTIESIQDNLRYIEGHIDTDNDNDMHRMAHLEIIEDQLCRMADHISNKVKANQPK